MLVSYQATVHDIEDIEDLGRRTKTCPYYGSRKAVRAAEVVTVSSLPAGRDL